MDLIESYSNLWTNLKVDQNWKIRTGLLHEGLNVPWMIFINNVVTHSYTLVLTSWLLASKQPAFLLRAASWSWYKSRGSPQEQLS
jgi:hypothetical protein